MLRLLFIAIIFCSGLTALAQPEGATIEERNGKNYYVHIVQKGNTLYGIHKLYQVPIADILNSNEGMSEDLEIGQKIYIPTGEDAKMAGSDFVLHKVSSGETLYGISKKYKCTVDDIKRLNPGAGEGISIGQELKIPLQGGESIPTDPVVENQQQYDISFKDSIIDHTVMEHETMYSISKRYMVSMDTIRAVNGMKNNKVRKGDVIKIPLKKVNYQVIKKDINEIETSNGNNATNLNSERKDTYNIALMLPFMLDKNEHEMTKTLKPGQEREMYSTTKIAYAFYQGFKYAADTLAKAGLKINLYVYDTKRDSNAIAKLFSKPEFDNMDLVVGPLYQSCVSYAARICKEKQIRIVLPFKTPTKHLHENPYAFNSVASNMTLMDGMVDFVVNNRSKYNVILLKPFNTDDKALYERARDRFNTEIKKQSGSYNAAIKELELGSSSGRELNAHISKDTTNIIIVPSADVKYVSGALNRMNKVMNMNPYAKNLKIMAYGFEDWNNFDDIDILHRNRMYQHYASYRYVDYNSVKGKKFVKAYRSNYGIDPNVYSTQGYDVGLYFLSALHLYGVGFENNLSSHSVDQVQNEFHFESVGTGSGWENRRVCVIMYNDYKLIQVQ